jgi:hypothetical protein
MTTLFYLMVDCFKWFGSIPKIDLSIKSHENKFGFHVVTASHSFRSQLYDAKLTVEIIFNSFCYCVIRTVLDRKMHVTASFCYC